MKRIFLPLVILILLSALSLTGCSGSTAATGWPGLAVSQDTIFSTFRGFVYAVNPRDGSLIWRYPEKADSKKVFYSDPAISGDQLIVGDFENQIFSLDVKTGKENWSFSDAAGRFIAGPLTVGNLIVAPSADYNIYALDMKGTLVWKFASQNQVWAKPVSDGESVFVASLDHHLYSLNLTDGKMAWSIDLKGPVTYSLLRAEDNTLYVGTLSNEMIAVDGKNGKVLWRSKTDGAVWGRPVLKDGILYFGDDIKDKKGNVYALSASDGALKWKSQADGPVLGAVVIFNGWLAFGTETGQIASFDLDGKKVWVHQVSGGKLYSDILVLGDHLLGASTQGDKMVVALDKNGNEAWGFVPPK